MDDDQKRLELQKRVNNSPIGNKIVKDFMNAKPIYIQEKTTIEEAINLMRKHRVSGLPVVSNDKRVEGVISEFDLLVQAGSKSLKTVIKYSNKVITVTPETPLKDVLILLYKYKIKRLPVVSSNKLLLGVVSRIDVLGVIADNL